MKKWPILLGISSLLVIGILLLGPIRANTTVNRLIQSGNKAFESGDYAGAISHYQEAEKLGAMDQRIAYNAGLTALKMGDFATATSYLEQVESAYLEKGNAYYYLGSEGANQSDQMSAYQQALDSYKQGMIQDSMDMDLKYNYEYVAQLLEALENQEQENQKQESQEGQDQQNQDQQNQDQVGQGEENQDQEGQDQEGQQDSDDQSADHTDQNQENQTTESENQTSGSTDEKQQPSNSEELESEEILSPNDQALNQILQLLEQQEADSLKNNQGILVGGKEDGNDW